MRPRANQIRSLEDSQSVLWPGRSVLVVEDDEDTREILEETFRYREFRVISTSDGRGGLDKARAEQPDLVVLDLSLPEMHGLQVLRALRTDPQTRSIPVLVFTAGAEDPQAQLAGRESRVKLLPKPAGPSVILAAARDLLKSLP